MNDNTLILDAFWVSNRLFPTVQDDTSKEGQTFHTYYSGTARHLGWMDLVLLKDIIKIHHINHIILQNLNTLGKIAQKTGSAKVCVAYEYNRFIVNTFSHKPKRQLLHCKPLYQDAIWGGWDFSDDDDKIPLRAQEYMKYLLIRTRVDSITCITNKVKVTAHWNESGYVEFDTEPNL